jgi:hypothetical protein
MAKRSSVKARNKALKKLDNAIKRAVKRGVPEDVLERTVSVATEKAATKKSPVRGSAPKTARGLTKSTIKAAKVPDEDLN